jgi:hypothetical protein
LAIRLRLKYGSMIVCKLLKGAGGLTSKVFYDTGNRHCFATGALIRTDREGGFENGWRVTL